jgi:2-oxoglutarate dehydrogenase E2 component (dihydrolipoamide succinyltransferase)
VIVEVKVPVLAESVAEATLISWHKKQGDVVKRGDNLIDIETDKVTLEVAALSDGVLTEIIRNDGDSVKSDEVIARIDSNGKSDKAAEPKKTEAAVPQQQSLPVDSGPAVDPKTSPAVRNMLSEHKLEARQIPDSNSDGRVTKEDVVNYLNQGKPAQAVSKQARPAETAPTAKAEAPAKVAPVKTTPDCVNARQKDY